ncbi:hypothetical protein CG709_10920, partial [Lachnotalea glycerini]
MRLETRENLKSARASAINKIKKENCRILICAGTGCLAGGSDKIYKKLKEMAKGVEGVTLEFGEEAAHVGVHES